MKRFKIINMANFGSGRLQLSTGQAQARLHNLTHIKDDIYEIVKPVQFKTGEELGYDGEINKLLMLDIEEAEAEKKGKLPVKELIEKINACETIAEVQALTETETRKKVFEAADRKIEELEKFLTREAEGGINIEEIIAYINAQELESEVDAICAELDGDLLTEDEKAMLEEAAEKRIKEIRSAKE